MPRHWHENTFISIQENISSQELSNPSITDSEKCSRTKAQVKDYKMAIKNMLEIFKEKMNKSINEVYENHKQRWNIMETKVQDMNVKIESLKRTKLRYKWK